MFSVDFRRQITYTIKSSSTLLDELTFLPPENIITI